jgi:hypothetical protein
MSGTTSRKLLPQHDPETTTSGKLALASLAGFEPLWRPVAARSPEVVTIMVVGGTVLI